MRAGAPGHLASPRPKVAQVCNGPEPGTLGVCYDAAPDCAIPLGFVGEEAPALADNLLCCRSGRGRCPFAPGCPQIDSLPLPGQPSSYIHISPAGGVLETLSALGERENTIVAFTSDHGEHLGQHNLYQKMEMHEQALRVPLVMAGPGIRPLRCGTPVSHLDLMPTVLELLGLEHPSALDGISLAPALAGDAAVPDRPIFAQYSGNPSLGDIRRCVIRGNQKYIFDPRDKAELFDLAEDPEEMRNLADLPEHQALLGELHELCARWGREHGDKAFEW